MAKVGYVLEVQINGRTEYLAQGFIARLGTRFTTDIEGAQIFHQNRLDVVKGLFRSLRWPGKTEVTNYQLSVDQQPAIRRVRRGTEVLDENANHYFG